MKKKFQVKNLRKLRITPTPSLLWETASAINTILKIRGSHRRVTVNDSETGLMWKESTKGVKHE